MQYVCVFVVIGLIETLFMKRYLSFWGLVGAYMRYWCAVLDDGMWSQTLRESLILDDHHLLQFLNRFVELKGK